MKAALQVLTMKVETTYGTDATPTTSANRILAQNVNINPLRMETDDYAPVSEAFGVFEKIVGSTLCDVSFDVLLSGGGTPVGNVGGVPKYDAVMRACAMARVIDPGVRIAYTNIDTGEESASMYYYLDGVLQKMVGLRGSLSWNWTAKKAPVLSFKGLGLNVPMVDTALPTEGIGTPIRPLAVNNANTSVTIDGSYNARCSMLTLDQGNEVVYRDLTGRRSTDVVDRRTTGKIVLEMPLVAEKDFLGAAGICTRATAVNLFVNHGNVAGNTLRLNLVSAQLFNPKPKVEAGILMLDCDLHVVRNNIAMACE